MAKRDLYSSISVVNAVAPSVITATGNGVTIDTLGFESATIVVTTGAIVGAGNVTVKLQESDDGTTFTDVAASDQLGAFPAALVTATTIRVGYKGFKRYIRAVTTLNSGTSVAAGAVAVLGHPLLGFIA